MANNSVIFFTRESLHARILANELAQKFNLAAIVLQQKPPAANARITVRILQKLLGTNNLEHLLILRKSKAEREVLLAEEKLKTQAQKQLATQLQTYAVTKWPSVPVYKTENVNSAQIEDIVTGASPAIIAVLGTGIIRKNIIDIPSIGIINAHTSILPKYKGSFVEFWQCLNSDYDYAGVTYHFINEKVDDGDIISAQKYTGPTPVDPFTLRNQNTLSIVKNYPLVIDSVLKGTYTKTKQPAATGKAHMYKHITTELKRTLFEKLGVI